MNFLSVVIISGIYFIVSGYLLYKFFKNDMSLEKTWKDIRRSIFFCCIKNENEIDEKLGKGSSKRIKKHMDDIDDCHEPVGFPFDICFDGQMSKEDMILREKLLQILKQRNNVVIDGGKEKLVVPLEATVFLTKDLNPLVNENGEIMIVAKHKQLSKRLEEVVFLLKGNDEVIYEDKKDLIEALEILINDVTEDEIIAKQKEELMNENENIEKREVSKDKIEEEVETTIDKIIDESLEEESLEDETGYKKEDNDLDLQIKESTGRKEIEEVKERPIISNDIEEDPFGSEDEEIDFNELLKSELGELDFEDEIEDEEENLESFYKNLEYKTAKVDPLDFENIEESIKKVFWNQSAISAFFRNLAKTHPIIMSSNKEVAFVDQQNAYFAIAKIYGLDAKKYIEQFKKMKIKDMQKANNGIAEALEDYIADSVSENKKAMKMIIEKDGEYFYSFGFPFMTNSFKTGLKSDEFDFFRSFPYNNDYKMAPSANTEGKLPKLINSIEDVEIK